MGRIRRRKGNRIATAVAFPIVVFAADKRIEGQILDLSESGVRILLPSGSGLTEQQPVRLLLKKERKVGRVVRVLETEEGDQVSLQLK